MSDERGVFDPINDLGDMRRMNVQAAMSKGVPVEEALRQWEEVPAEQQDAVRALWDSVQQQFAKYPGAVYMPTNGSFWANSHRWGG